MSDVQWHMAIWGNIYHPAAIEHAKKQARKKAKKAAKAARPPRPARTAPKVAQVAPERPRFPQAPQYVPNMGKEFYQTREWRTVRYGALLKYGNACQCCGQTQGYLHVDHIKPRSRYPLLELAASNLQILCEACNIGKSNNDQTDWRKAGVG